MQRQGFLQGTRNEQERPSSDRLSGSVATEREFAGRHDEIQYPVAEVRFLSIQPAVVDHQFSIH